MKLQYSKPPLSFEKQLELLIRRGLIVHSKQLALSKLSIISYYRLSAYWYPFRKRNANKQITDTFIAGTTFKECIRLYEFDRQLRVLMLDAIERIEVAIRTKITYFFAHMYGVFGHCESQNFHPAFNHQDWIEDIQKETCRSKDEFVMHYKEKYSTFPTLPIWMLTETMSLGNLSKLYNGMKNDDKKEIAQQFKVHYKTLTHWLHTLTYIRNICAHHSRLWNREFGIRPEKIKDKEWLPPITPRNDRIFYVLLIARCLLKITQNGEDWFKKVNDLIRPLATHITYRAAMGIPQNWEGHPIWKEGSGFENKT
jgi:abortive infection bacteriophage resistance protein